MTTADDSTHWRVQQTNRLATASMACGMLALVFTPLAILAIVFGHIARGQIRRTGEGGRRKATAGLVLGYVVLVAVVITLVVAFLILLAVNRPARLRTPADADAPRMLVNFQNPLVIRIL